LKTVDVGKDFYPRLTNRDERQRDGRHTGRDFRTNYLAELLDNKEAWRDDSTVIELDFSNVTKMGPSWANEVFAYFAKYEKPKSILKKIRLTNISRVKQAIIEQEIEAGYSKR
jgi:hypothetical protein